MADAVYDVRNESIAIVNDGCKQIAEMIRINGLCA